MGFLYSKYATIKIFYFFLEILWFVIEIGCICTEHWQKLISYINCFLFWVFDFTIFMWFCGYISFLGGRETSFVSLPFCIFSIIDPAPGFPGENPCVYSWIHMTGLSNIRPGIYTTVWAGRLCSMWWSILCGEECISQNQIKRLMKSHAWGESISMPVKITWKLKLKEVMNS